MIYEHYDPAFEALAEDLEKNAAYRVLRRVPAPYTDMPEDGVPPRGKCLCIIDLETSSLDPAEGSIIELALMLVWVNDQNEVIGHLGPLSWLEEPDAPLDPRISLITNLTFPMLLGKAINDAAVLALIDRADMLVAHNSRFEVSWLEKRYPELADKPWGCSMKDIDWLMAGVDGRAQQHLLGQHGWFSTAHRAGPDVWSLFWLLQQRTPEIGSGIVRSHMQRLIEAAETDTVLVQAKRAPFDKKGALKSRGYQWNPSANCWQKELPPAALQHEQAWFYRTGIPAPETRPFSACERHR